MAKQKRYVIRKGKETGIYTSRDDCKARVNGYTGAQYKSYESLAAAEEAFAGTYASQVVHKTNKQQTKIKNYVHIVDHMSISVDAACSSNPGVLERQGVETISGKKLFSSTQYPLGTTNVGEWLAIIQGMRFLVEYDRKERIIYSDSRIALGRVTKGIIKTTLPRNQKTHELRSLIDEQLERLQRVGLGLLNEKKIILLKRKTKERGEIPADFGRK